MNATGNDEEFANVGLGMASASESSAFPKVNMKTAPDDENAKLEKQVDALAANLKNTLAMWQGFTTEVKLIKANGEEDDNEFAQALIQKCGKLEPQLVVINRVLSKMVGNKNFNRDEAKKLVEKMISTEELYNKVLRGGKQFGYVDEARPSGRGKKRSRGSESEATWK